MEVKPDRTASAPTASATRYEISRTSFNGGNSGPSGLLSIGENSLNTRAAAENIASVTRRAPDAITPNPTPGNMNALLHWPISINRPTYLVGENGLPVAIKARPSVHFTRLDGIASLLEVGFDSGKIAGRSTCLAISRTISSVKAPGWPDVPIKIVG